MQVRTLDTSTLASRLSVSNSSTRASAATSVASNPEAATTFDPSEAKKLIDQLSALQQSDPDKAAKVAGSMADQLEQAASDTGDKNLARVAAAFRDVESGTSVEDAFQPPEGVGGPRGAGGPPPGAPPGPPPGVSSDDEDTTTSDILAQLAEESAAESESTSIADSAPSGVAARAASRYLSHAAAKTIEEMLSAALAAE